jgi:DNA-binding beta-propeller fold protein YncE
MELIIVLDNTGKIIDEWGPFEDNAIITSVSAGNSSIVFADAGNKILVILDKQGGMKKMIGQNDGQFVIPSPYFDVAVDSAGLIYVANTGHRRIETRGNDGAIISYFGEPGTAPDSFCGCCNPAHFAKIKTGYITAEKGLNRIKILGESGEFKEFVSSKNDFAPSVPLDIASYDGKTIYAANPFDSKLYIFKRK